MVCSRVAFKKRLYSGVFDKCYFLFGREFFIIDESVNQLVNLVVDEKFRGFNFTEFDGADFDLENCDRVSKTIAVMSKYRVVLVKNLCYSKFNKSVLNKFVNMVKTLPMSSILIITISTENFNYSEIKKFNVWLNNFNKIATIVDCSVSDRELFKFCFSYVLSLGSKISRENFDFLVGRLAGNWKFIISELEKLSFYANGREIARDDILKMTKPSLNATAFDLAREILNFNLEKALLILHDLLNFDVNLLLIVGAINSCFIDLYRVFMCFENGLSNLEILNFFNYKGQEFKINNAKKMFGNFNLNKIRRCVNILFKLDFKLKTTAIEKSLLLEEAIVDMVLGS